MTLKRTPLLVLPVSRASPWDTTLIVDRTLLTLQIQSRLENYLPFQRQIIVGLLSQ
jgi:hypothetical protein